MAGSLLLTVLTMLALFGLLAGWVMVQAAARRAAVAHPEAGPYREIGADHGCGGHHGCAGCAQAGHCDTDPATDPAADPATEWPIAVHPRPR